MQEEGDVRFDWSAAARLRRAAIRSSWNDIVVAPTAPAATIDPDPIGGVVEELPGGAVVVEHLDGVDVHRSRH